eukprot:scaffold14415_cov56-Phaeocystis_antarctica.AAC.6
MGPATVCDGPCNRVRWALQPFVLAAAPCNPLCSQPRRAARAAPGRARPAACLRAHRARRARPPPGEG